MYIYIYICICIYILGPLGRQEAVAALAALANNDNGKYNN